MVDTKFRRRALVLGILIVVLAGTYVLGLVFSPARVEKRRAEAPLLPELDKEKVASIRIEDADGSVQLVREQEQWKLEAAGAQLPGSAERVKVLLDFLGEVKRTRVATENPELWKDFGVDTGAEHRVLLADAEGTRLVEVVIGNAEMAASGDYVRVEGSPEVVLSDRSFSYYTGTEPAFWSDLRILPAELRGSDIVRLSVDSEWLFPDQAGEPVRYTLRVGDEESGTWVIEGRPALKLDDARVDGVLSQVASMEANEFAVGVTPAAAGLVTPRGRVVVSTSAGKDYRLLIGAQAGEGQHYLSLEGGPYVYRVAEWRLRDLLKAPEELQAKESTTGEGAAQ